MVIISMEEEGIRFSASKGVFYNPNMTFCRSMSSLAVGAIGRKLEVCDAFCASGIRGIRYAKENENVTRTVFMDIDPAAIRDAKANARKNKIRHEAMKGNISRLVFDTTADFLEMDPFGSPAPYLYDAFRLFKPVKLAYLSVTATDVAVLCGGKSKACLKNYGSVPMNNEFTHETGMRMMVKRIAETAASFNMGIRPLVSFSDRHYLKSIMELRRGAELAYNSVSSFGHVEHCGRCGYRAAVRFPAAKCPGCGSKLDFAGPLWLGELQDRAFVRKMASLNAKRDYSQKGEVAKMLSLLEGEAGMPPYYYNVHVLSRINGGGEMPKMAAILQGIQKKGYRAARTHYSDVSIKTDAPLKSIRGML